MDEAQHTEFYLSITKCELCDNKVIRSLHILDKYTDIPDICDECSKMFDCGEDPLLDIVDDNEYYYDEDIGRWIPIE